MDAPIALSGHDISVQPDDGNASPYRASVRVADAATPHHVITYGDQVEALVVYVVGHEAAHLIPLDCVPPQDRLIDAASSNEGRCMRELLERRLPTAVQRLPSAIQHELIYGWHDPVARLVANLPADMRRLQDAGHAVI